MRFEEVAWVNSCSFLSLMSIENYIIGSLTVARKQKGERGDGLRHPRQRGIKRMKLQKLKDCNWRFLILYSC